MRRAFTHVSPETLKRYGIALLASMLLHALIYKSLNISLPSSDSPLSVISVQLAAVPKPEPVPELKPAEPKLEEIKPEVPESPPKAEPEPPKEPQIMQQKDSEQVIPETAPQAAPEPPIPSESETKEEVAEKPLEPAPEMASEHAAEPIPQLALGEEAPPYPYVYMKYQVSMGGTKIGDAETTFERIGESRYYINSALIPRGIASMLVGGALRQSSEGSVSAEGLRPEVYHRSFANKADKTYQANLDWQSNQVIMQTHKGEKRANLVTGAQDQLSFMFQFMYVPPLQQMALWITNGKKFSQYYYSFEGEEALSTPLGEIRTLHIVNTKSESEEKIDLWLAIEYRNVPVKIRLTEKDGDVFEQTLLELNTQDPR